MIKYNPARSAFQSTLPVWGGTAKVSKAWDFDTEFQSTLPVWGGTSCFVYLLYQLIISIHPPRVGRDRPSGRRWARLLDFNPPSPCGEGPEQCQRCQGPSRFQSTLPVWGGTGRVRPGDRGAWISIHPPRVGRDRAFCGRGVARFSISIHPPRVGRDDFHGVFSLGLGISIHPPRVGRDRMRR